MIAIMRRTRIVQIEACEWDGSKSAAAAIEAWSRGCVEPGDTLAVSTPEGVFHASPGDFIIKGPAGEFYPCKPDVFNAKYEDV